MHTIRLRRPWLRTASEGEQAIKVDVPDRTPAESDNRSIVRYERSFHRPTGLEDHENVWLTIESYSGGSIRVLLNESTLSDSAMESPVELAVTSHLRPTNRLLIEIQPTSSEPARIDGDVALRIG